MDEYVLTVKFRRFHSDDDPVVARKFGNGFTETDLRKQLADELQEAYDHGYLAGFFEVQEGIEIPEGAK